VVKLFDYTCHHCRELHHLLHRYANSNEVTIISLPVPLDSSCNKLMTRTPPDHVNACEYARLGLAVFRADAGKFATFSDWIFAPARPPALPAARAYAESLVGQPGLATNLNHPAIDQQIQTNIGIYLTSSKLAKNGRMPQLIFQNAASIGSVSGFVQLQKIMAENLARPGGRMTND
jgi:hypothetical protein